MNGISLDNAEIILPNKKISKGSLLIQDQAIAEISLENKSFEAKEVINLSNLKLFAGFIDIHNHGAVGFDVNSATAENLLKVSKFLAQNGVTAWLPTIVPDSNENHEKSIKAIAEAIQLQKNSPVAQILGVHYEGIFANQKMCGALRPEFFKTFEKIDEINQIPNLQTPDAIHLTTLAPEIKNGIELIKELKRRNWIVSIGHTKADVETLENAYEAGATHVTHLFNAMTGIHHRNIGVAGWALLKDDISCEIIADGVHVAPPLLKFACKNKPLKNFALVSDSVAPTGLGDGGFELWGEKISVVNGKTQNERGSIAGSVITLLDAVKMMLSLGFSETEVSAMASANPARILGIGKTHGTIEVGKQADLVALDAAGNLRFSMVSGRVAFSAFE